MKPLTLELENFECHSNSFIDFTSFNSALIIGKKKNDDRVSNGVGKSTIFRAVDYVLFKQARTNLDKLIRDDSDKCKVSLTFESSGSVYKVARARSNKSKSGESDLELFEKINNEWKKITKRSNSETEAELSSIIKIGYKAFKYSVHFSQNDIGLAHVTPDKRKQMLKEPLQLIIYNKLEKIAKLRLSETTKESDKIKGMIDILGDPSKDIKVSEEELLKIKSNLLDCEKKLQKSNKEISSSREDLIKLQKLMSSDTTSINEKYNNIKNKKFDLIKLISKIEKEIHELNEDLNSSLLDLEQKTLAFEKLKEKFESLKKIDNYDILSIEQELKNLYEEESNLISKKGAGDSKYKELSSLLLPESGTKCNSCKQIVTQEHIEACLKETNEQIEKIKKIIEKIKVRLNEINELKKIKEKDIATARSVKNDISSLQDKIINCSDILKNKKLSILKIENSIKIKTQDLNTERNNLDTINTEEKDLEDKIKNLSKNDLDRKIFELSNDIKIKENEIINLNSLISSISSKIGSLTERINNKKEDEIKIKECIENKKILDFKIKIQDAVAKAYSSSGIPTIIIYTILNDLQIESNNLLSELRPGMELMFEIDKPNESGEIQDTLDILYKINGKDREWDQLSGGEQFYVDIALKLGLAKVIQSRLGVNIEFLELDEVDARLDKAGVDALADVIKKWQSKFKILVITHNDTLKQKFRYNILVENDGANGSMAKVIDCGDIS